MSILAFDQASNVSGWSLFDGNQYIDSGIVDCHTVKDSDIRIQKMGLELGAIIDKCKPNAVVIENIQNQSSIATVILLGRLQGIVIGYCAAHDIPVHIISPTQWRKILNFTQGPGVKRTELKAQSMNYVKEHFDLDFSEDRSEAICINVAAREMFNLN